MRTIFSIFIWVWIFILLLIFFPIVNILLFLPRNQHDPMIKWMTRTMLTLIGVKVKVEFAEKLDKNGTYLFLSNHVNILDTFLLYGYIPAIVRGVELVSHFRWPIYGWTLRRMGNIPIDRVNASKAIISINKAAAELRKGNSILMLPEGHRTRTSDEKLGKLMRGSFILARDGGRDIVPIILSGGWEVTHRGSWKVLPGKIIMKFGKVIRENEFRGLGTNELRDLCRLRLEEIIEDES
ncbi:MAG: 1-acyl-sn-glycerol-3-phosphate acyltransferase [Candidatus Marinimicrobia bacterium]|nr:1-acyl-sn-glycerol-3-phosphate acyltransferase [Candidatus Neomarinimicrobiota bacterium]